MFLILSLHKISRIFCTFFESWFSQLQIEINTMSLRTLPKRHCKKATNTYYDPNPPPEIITDNIIFLAIISPLTPLIRPRNRASAQLYLSLIFVIILVWELEVVDIYMYHPVCFNVITHIYYIMMYIIHIDWPSNCNSTIQRHETVTVSSSM